MNHNSSTDWNPDFPPPQNSDPHTQNVWSSHQPPNGFNYQAGQQQDPTTAAPQQPRRVAAVTQTPTLQPPSSHPFAHWQSSGYNNPIHTMQPTTSGYTRQASPLTADPQWLPDQNHRQPAAGLSSHAPIVIPNNNAAAQRTPSSHQLYAPPPYPPPGYYNHIPLGNAPMAQTLHHSASQALTSSALPPVVGSSSAGPSQQASSSTSTTEVTSKDKVIPRPRNAFMLFSNAWYENRRQSNGGNAEGNKLNPKQISREWRALSDNQKAKWKAEANEEQRQHQLKHPDYRFRPKPKQNRSERKATGKAPRPAMGSTIIASAHSSGGVGTMVIAQGAPPFFPYRPPGDGASTILQASHAGHETSVSSLPPSHLDRQTSRQHTHTTHREAARPAPYSTSSSQRTDANQRRIAEARASRTESVSPQVPVQGIQPLNAGDVDYHTQTPSSLNVTDTNTANIARARSASLADSGYGSPGLSRLPSPVVAPAPPVSASPAMQPIQDAKEELGEKVESEDPLYLWIQFPEEDN